MKKTLSWILLAIYLCASCSGLLPIVQDLVAHIFWQRAHIEHVHHGWHGDGHVAVEMAQLIHFHAQDQALASGFDAGKVSLSVHLCQTTGFEASPAAAVLFRHFPPYYFDLPCGVRTAVFLPPESV